MYVLVIKELEGITQNKYHLKLNKSSVNEIHWKKSDTLMYKMKKDNLR